MRLTARGQIEYLNIEQTNHSDKEGIEHLGVEQVACYRTDSAASSIAHGGKVFIECTIAALPVSASQAHPKAVGNRLFLIDVSHNCSFR